MTKSLLKGSTLSTSQARKRFDMVNVGARIAELRVEGYDIDTMPIYKKGAQGRPEAKYKLYA